MKYRLYSLIFNFKRITGFDLFKIKTLIFILIFLALSSLNVPFAESSQTPITTQDSKTGSLNIQGGRMKHDPGHFSNAQFDDWERGFIEKIRNEEVEEIYALLSAGYWGGYGQIIIYANQETKKIIYDQGFGKYSYYNFTTEEYQEFKGKISRNQVENLPPLRNNSFDGIQYEFVHLKKGIGRRVYMNNPHEEDQDYLKLVSLFRELVKKFNFISRHKAVDDNPSAQILLKRDFPRERIAFLKRFQRKKESCVDQLPNWQGRFNNRFIYGDFEGLIFCDPNNPYEKEIIMNGWYSKPVVVSNENIAVVGKTDTNWADPNYVVIVNLETKTEKKVNLEVADNFDPIAYLDEQERFLLVRFQDSKVYGDRKPVGPKDPKYYLLNSTTGETQVIQGEFFPWLQHYEVPLQKSSFKNKVWVAQPDFNKNVTDIGLYDTINFKFTKTQTIKSIYFTSSHMWVDESDGLLFVEPDIIEFNSENILQFQLNKPSLALIEEGH